MQHRALKAMMENATGAYYWQKEDCEAFFDRGAPSYHVFSFFFFFFFSTSSQPANLLVVAHQRDEKPITQALIDDALGTTFFGTPESNLRIRFGTAEGPWAPCEDAPAGMPRTRLLEASQPLNAWDVRGPV